MIPFLFSVSTFCLVMGLLIGVLYFAGHGSDITGVNGIALVLMGVAAGSVALAWRFFA